MLRHLWRDLKKEGSTRLKKGSRGHKMAAFDSLLLPLSALFCPLFYKEIL
jgi:hypothetical protein